MGLKIFENIIPLFFILLIQSSCETKNKSKSIDDIHSINLKRGEVVLCGPADKQFGSLAFNTSCSEKVRGDFNLGMALLHSFEYDEAEKVFAKVIDEEPGCAMAYWGVAMCNFHPLWAPPTESELKKGTKLIELARSLGHADEMESAYIHAMAVFYEDADKLDHHTRCISYRNEMGLLHIKYPKDKEAAIFYALALDAAADPADKSYADQRKAGAILIALYPDEPNHPGIVHYIIHTYDYPGLAELALPAARKYASIAPASAHAQHMPSHIFTRLGLWDESIKSNLISTSSAKCYAENARMKGHWDEELHGMDYLLYAYLQKGEDSLAKELCDYLNTIHEVNAVNFKVAYAFAAIPSRYLLEKKMWKEAANLKTHPVDFPWEKFPWQNAIIHYTRLLGMVHTGDIDSASIELKKLKQLHDTLFREGDMYKANQVEIQIKSSMAWMLYKGRKYKQALDLIRSAADMEDATEKHPVTPGEVIPARELLGDMLLEMGYSAKALEVYQEDLKNHPGRLNGLLGAGLSAEKSGNNFKAQYYFQQLSNQCAIHSSRPALVTARLFLRK
jgi:tetratricopeptide (TPR) repeat protein